MSCTYKERMFNLPTTQQTKGPVPAASPVASNSSSTSSTSQSPLPNGGPSQIRLPPKKDFRSESEQQQLQQIQKVSPFPTSSSQSQAIRNADSPLDLSVKTRKRCADTTIFDYFLGGMSPIKRPKAGTAGVPPIPLDLTKTKSSPMKQMAPPAGMLSPAYATANPYAYKNMTPKAPSSSPSKSKSVKPSKGKEYHTIRSLPPDSVGRMSVGQPQQSTSGRQKLVNGYINFSSIFPPRPPAVGSAGLSPSSLMNKSHAGCGGDSRLSGSHQQISHGLRELSAESVKSSPSQRGLTLYEQQQQQQQQQHSQATSRSHHIQQQQQQQQYNYSQQRQLHSQQPHYQSPRRLHTSVNQRSQHTSQRPPPIQQQQQSTSSQRSAPPQQQAPPPHCQSNNPRLRDHDLISHQHRLQRLQQHYLQQQQHRQQQSPIHPPSSSSSLASPITISSPTSPSGPGRSSTPSSSSSVALTAPSSSSTSSSTLSSASSTRLLPVSVSSAYSDVSATSGAAGVSAKVFPFHQLEQSSIKNYDGLVSSHKANPNVGLAGETMVNSGSGVEITSSGLNRYSPDSTDCTISGVSKRMRIGSDLLSQQRHLHQSYQDQQLLSAQMYAGGIGLDKLTNTGNSKGYSGYKTMPMSPYHQQQQQQLYMPMALQKVSGADGQKKRSQTVGHTSMSKQSSVFSDPASNKSYNSAYYYQQQQRHLLMTASKYDGAGMATGSIASISHHVSSPPSSYTSPAPTTTAISSSTAASSTPSAMASVQNIQKQKHFNSLPMKSPSRSSVDSNDDVKIIGSTPAPGSSTPSSSSTAPPRSLKEVPVINIISDGREPLSAGRGAAGNGQATGGRRMHAAIDYHHDPQEEAESTKRFNTPLSINIPNEMIQETPGMGMPSGKSDMISGKPVMTESRDPKLGSRKHIIMNAVNQDEALKKVFHVENGSGVSINPHEESLSEASFNSISPAPSPKMPILSPQHKNPPRMGSPSTSDPPPLEPSPATFLENPSPVSFVQENLSNNDQIVRPNLEIKRAPTNAAPQRPKPPIAYLQDPMFRGQFPPSVFAQHMPYLSAFNTPLHPYMQMIPSAEHSVHSAASRIPEGTVNAASGVPPAGMAATTKGVMESVREKREGFNVRSTARSKNIPVANVAPIVQAKNYRQNSTSSSSNGNSISLNSNTSSSLGLPLNAASSNSNSNHSNSSDEVKIISGPTDGPCRSGGAGEKRRSKGGSNISGPGGRGDSSGNGGGLKEASGKISPTMPRTFFSPHNIISMFKNSKNEKIIESMCCDKNAQRGKMSLKDAINTLLEKHCKELHVETDQGEGSPSCLSSSSRSSDVEIIENPFERDDDPLMTEFSNSASAANSNPHLLKNSSTTSTTSTITTTITNTTTFGTIVTSAINRATMSDCGRSTNGSIPVSYNAPKSQKPQQNTQLLLNKHQDKDVIALSDDPEAPNFDPVDHTGGGSNGADVNMAGLGDIENEAHFNRLKQKLLRSMPADSKTNAEVPLTGFKKNNNYKTSNPTCDVSGVDCSSGVKGRSGCDYLNDKSTKCLELSCDADVRESPAKSISDTREHSSDFYPGSESFVTQRVHHCQEKKITPEDQNMVKNQPTKKQNLNEMFKQSRRKDKYSSDKRKSSGRRLAEELKRKAVMGAVVYQKTLYQEFNERTRIGRTTQEGENRMIMTRSSTQRRSSQRPRCRSSLRPRAARPERGALAEKDSEEEESLPGCWEIECSSPSLRLRRRRAGAISATGNSSSNNGTSHSKKRLMLTLHWRPRRASQNFCVSGRRKFRVVNRYASRHKRNVFGSQLPHSYSRQTLDWADVRRLPAPNRKNLPGRSSVTTMDDPYELRDEETESVASNSNSVSGSVPIPPEIRRIAINKNSGETILHRSARCGYEDVLLHCLQTKSVDVNARDNAGFTPLHECCVRGNLLIARYLITFGADVNQCSQDGIRPIHDAVENDHIEMARLLLSFGADPLLTTYSGKSPIKIARSGRMISLLKDHISDLNGEEGHEGTPWEFHGSWDLKEFDAKSGNPIFEDLPSDSEDSDSEDFIFDDCPLATFSLSSDIDKKYLSVPDIAFHTGKKLEKIREICEPNIFTMKYDDFVNDTQGLVCLQSTKARIKTNKCDFVELLEADKYASVLTRISGRSLTDSNKASPQRESLTGASSKSGHNNNTKAGAQSSSKFINEREAPPPKGGVALSPLSFSDNEISPLDKAESTYRAGSSSMSLTTTATTTKESVAQSERSATVTTGSALPESPNLPEKSNLRNNTYDYHENANDTPAPSLAFKERFSGGQSKAGKKKRVALDTVLSRSKSATSTTSATTTSTTTTSHASSARHNGHFTIKLGNLSDDGHKNYGIDQSARVSEHSGRSPRKTTKDASPSYTDNVDYAKKKKIPTDTSVVIDR